MRNCPEVVDIVAVLFGLVAVGRTDYVSVQCGLYTSHGEVRTKHVMSNGVRRDVHNPILRGIPSASDFRLHSHLVTLGYTATDNQPSTRPIYGFSRALLQPRYGDGNVQL